MRLLDLIYSAAGELVGSRKSNDKENNARIAREDSLLEVLKGKKKRECLMQERFEDVADHFTLFWVSRDSEAKSD